MRLCDLKASEVDAYRTFGARPNCRMHEHVRPDVASRRVAQLEAEWVEVGGKRSAIVATRVATNGAYDRAVMTNDNSIPCVALSDGSLVVQLVQGGRGKRSAPEKWKK